MKRLIPASTSSRSPTQIHQGTVKGYTNVTMRSTRAVRKHRQNQPVVAHDNAEVPRHGCDRGRRRIAGLARFPEEKQDHKKHREDTQRSHPVNILDAQVAMGPGSKIGTSSAANVDHGVVNRIANRANVFLGGAGRGADHAGFYQRDAERGKDQDETDKQSERHRVAHRRQPGCADGADQKISGSQDEVCDRKRAAEAQAVGGGPAEDGQKPDHAAEYASQRSGLLGGEIQLLLQIQSQRSERSVVGKALENFGDIGDPEGPLEAGANFTEALRKVQRVSQVLFHV